jgi:peptidoglycan/xylan/chitin deacetylase (PgdA/CDA1 family)
VVRHRYRPDRGIETSGSTYDAQDEIPNDWPRLGVVGCGGEEHDVRNTIRAGAAAGLRRVALVKDRARCPPAGVTVLIYHRVGGRTPVPVDLPAEQFAAQVAQVVPRAVTLDQALSVLEDTGPEQPGPGPVVVTFDDGTSDVVEEALPILVEHRVPMVLYLATKFIDEQVEFPDAGRPTSWAALADGLSTGFLQIGSHTHSHALLDRLEPALVPDELDRSIGLIHDRLGVDPVHFAYPKALPGSPAADAAVRARFRSAAVAGTRTNPYGATDPWALARTPIQTRDEGRWFDAKAAGGLGLEDDVRRVVNRVRYRAATS